jgi:hypothetical protein
MNRIDFCGAKNQPVSSHKGFCCKCPLRSGVRDAFLRQIPIPAYGWAKVGMKFLVELNANQFQFNLFSFLPCYISPNECSPPRKGIEGNFFFSFLLDRGILLLLEPPKKNYLHSNLRSKIIFDATRIWIFIFFKKKLRWQVSQPIIIMISHRCLVRLVGWVHFPTALSKVFRLL